MWTVVEKTERKGQGYGLGWAVVPKRNKFGGIKSTPFYVYHTGGAIGACSVLLILPRSNVDSIVVEKDRGSSELPRGVSVAIICNLQGINLEPVAMKIAQAFQKCSN